MFTPILFSLPDCCVHCILACLFCEFLTLCNIVLDCATCGSCAGDDSCFCCCCMSEECGDCDLPCDMDCGIIDACCESADCLEICMECCSLCFSSWGPFVWLELTKPMSLAHCHSQGLRTNITGFLMQIRSATPSLGSSWFTLWCCSGSAIRSTPPSGFTKQHLWPILSFFLLINSNFSLLCSSCWFTWSGVWSRENSGTDLWLSAGLCRPSFWTLAELAMITMEPLVPSKLPEFFKHVKWPLKANEKMAPFNRILVFL